MVTCIADLLDLADREAARPDLDPRVAARSLQATERLLAGQREEPARHRGLRPQDPINKLQDATRRAAALFGDGTPGRLADLVDAAADAAGRLRDEISDADRSMIAVSAASVVRRCGSVIAGAAPHGQVPELTALRLAAGELIRSATRTPPDPALIRGIHVPLASPVPDVARGAGLAVVEWSGILVSHFRNQSRDLLTVTQLIGAARAAEHIAAVLAKAGVTGAGESTRLWRITRDALGCFADVPDRRRQTRSQVLEAAREIDVAIRRVTPSDLPAIVRTGTCLPVLARELRLELHRIQGRVVVGGGSRPLTEERVADWLRHRVAPATPADIGPVERVLTALISLNVPMMRAGIRSLASQPAGDGYAIHAAP